MKNFNKKDGKSPLLVLNSKRPALTYELEQKHDAKWIARVTIGQEQFTGEGYKKNIAKGIFLKFFFIGGDVQKFSDLIWNANNNIEMNNFFIENILYVE